MTAWVSEPVTAGGLGFAMPPDWVAVRVPRRAAPQQLRILAAVFAAADVLCACTTALAVPGGPLPATLLVSSYPTGGQAVDQIAGRLAAGGGSATGSRVDRFDLPIGRTARVEWRPDRGAPEQPRRPGSLVIQYVAGIPGTANAVILTFATPAVTLAAWLRPLFHQIAGTVRMEHPDREQERSCT
jgi:hypothetical protein